EVFRCAKSSGWNRKKPATSVPMLIVRFSLGIRIAASSGVGNWLHAWLPALRILSRPERHRVLVVADVAVLGLALQRSACAMRDVAEVAEKRALVSLFNFAIEFCAGADRRQPVAEVLSLGRLRRRELH